MQVLRCEENLAQTGPRVSLDWNSSFPFAFDTGLVSKGLFSLPDTTGREPRLEIFFGPGSPSQEALSPSLEHLDYPRSPLTKLFGLTIFPLEIFPDIAIPV